MNVELVEHSCCNCHMIFWIPVKMDERLRNDKASFYCPQGHSQSYTGESQEAKIKRLENEKASVILQRDNYFRKLNTCERAKQRLLKEKGEKKE